MTIYETEAIFFNKTGLPIGDLVGTFNRQWVKNGYGEAKFTMTVETYRAKFKMFETGNFLLLREENLPDWVGYLDVPETWDDAKISMTAFSAERLFEQRPGVVDKLYGTGGSIFERVIEMANGWGDTLMRPGEIYYGGTSREESFSPASQLYNDIRRVSGRAKNDWDITPLYANGKLTLLGNWYEAKRKKTAFALSEGVNIQRKEGALEYEGPIWNHIVAYGNASNWASREMYEAWDDESISRNGLRVKGISVNSNSPATVQNAAENYLAVHKKPRCKLDVSATDVEGTFQELRIGHAPVVESVHVGRDEGEVGFRGVMEIIEMTYRHEVRLMDLVLNEIL